MLYLAFDVVYPVWGLPKNNPGLVVNRTWIRDLRISSTAPQPLSHVRCLKFLFPMLSNRIILNVLVLLSISQDGASLRERLQILTLHVLMPIAFLLAGTYIRRTPRELQLSISPTNRLWPVACRFPRAGIFTNCKLQLKAVYSRRNILVIAHGRPLNCHPVILECRFFK